MEVAQRATKALRFGMAEVQSAQSLSNAERIAQEVADLVAALQMLEAACGSSRLPVSGSTAVAAKQAKVEHSLRYPTERGTLCGPDQ